MKRLPSTPRGDGFRMPGEYERHNRCWMLWPQRPDVWRNGGKPAQKAFVEVARAIRRFEPVTVGVNPDQYRNACRMLPPDIRVVELSHDDAWMRDVGPTFVVNSKGDVRGVDWGFNAWGGLDNGLYFPWDKDSQVCRKVCETAERDFYQIHHFILEGGSIHVDGDGTVLTTEECLLHPGRNPKMTREEIEGHLLDYLGADKVIWLPRGIYLDETDGHVDNIACFARPGEILLSWTDDTADPQYERSAECLKVLENTTDARGRKIKVHKLPLPKPIHITPEEGEGVDAAEDSQPRIEGTRLAASYVNFYLPNGGLVFPLFGDPADREAEAVLREVFPDREVVGVPGREILLGGGNIHCITQQEPLGK